MHMNLSVVKVKLYWQKKDNGFQGIGLTQQEMAGPAQADGIALVCNGAYRTTYISPNS